MFFFWPLYLLVPLPVDRMIYDRRVDTGKYNTNVRVHEVVKFTLP
jgi:hypothetical protein